MKTIDVVAAIIKQGDCILATQRGYGDHAGGWEFPGGKIEPGETAAEALVRELAEELAVRAVPGELLAVVPAGRVVLNFVAAELPEDEEPRPCEHQEYFWVEVTPEPPVGLLPADRDFWRTLAGG